MEVKEKISDGLKRQYSILIASADIEEKIQSKLESLVSQVNLPGFRPGKVPKNVIRARFGKEVFGEVIKETIDNTTKETFEKNNLKPALQPKIDIKEGFKEGDDLEYTIDIEILPEIEVKDFKEIKLEQMVSKPKEEDLNDALNRLASEQRTFEVSKDSSIKSKKDDAVIIDFVGKINDEPFDGGKAQDTQLILGSGQFIPGFEEQLIGYKSGESVTVKVKFPDNYQSDDLKGKDAVFDVDIKEVKNPRTPEIDDKLAEGLGLKDLTELKERVNEQIQNEYNQISRSKLKKNLLDNLDSYFTFDLPPTLVENEFNIIWQQIEADKKNNKLDDADKSKNEDVLKEEYRVIAERRVKLGLILNDIGLKNDIKVEHVFSSEWCRCKDTAFHAFNSYKTFDALNSFYSEKFYKNKNKQIKNLKKFISNWDNNSNLVLVTHYVVILEMLGIGTGSGEIIISNKKYEIKDRIEIN